MGEILDTPIGRLNYVFLERKSQYSTEDTDLYQVTLYLDPKECKEGIARLKQAIDDEAGSIRNNPRFKNCLSKCEHPDFPDHYQLIMKYKVDAGKPLTLMMRDQKRQEIGPEKFYSGCFARAKITFKQYNSKQIGVTAYLKGLQFVGDGESLYAAENVDEFDVVQGYDELADIA